MLGDELTFLINAVKTFKHVNTCIIPLVMRKTREFKLSICVVIWVFIFVFILHLAKEYLQPWHLPLLWPTFICDNFCCNILSHHKGGVYCLCFQNSYFIIYFLIFTEKKTTNFSSSFYALTHIHTHTAHSHRHTHTHTHIITLQDGVFICKIANELRSNRTYVIYS